MATISDYDPEEVRVCLDALVELFRSLGELGEHIVLIGGWTPYLLCGKVGVEEHVGSLDIDITLSFSAVLDMRTSQEIGAILKELRYYNKYGESFHRFIKEFKNENGRNGRVILDLFTNDEGVKIKWDPERGIQEPQVYKLKGAELVFDNPIEFDLSPFYPGDSADKIIVRIVNPAVFITLKAFTLGGEGKREEDKDAYDIWFILEHFPMGIDRILEFIDPIRDHEVVKEALQILEQEYAGIESVGPTGAARFQDRLEEGSDEFERVRRSAYESVQYILSGIKRYESTG